MTPRDLKTTHTYVEMDLHPNIVKAIEARLREANYEHCISDEGILLTGVMIVNADGQGNPAVKWDDTPPFPGEEAPTPEPQKPVQLIAPEVAENEGPQDHLNTHMQHAGEGFSTTIPMDEVIPQMRADLSSMVAAEIERRKWSPTQAAYHLGMKVEDILHMEIPRPGRVLDMHSLLYAHLKMGGHVVFQPNGYYPGAYQKVVQGTSDTPFPDLSEARRATDEEVKAMGLKPGPILATQGQWEAWMKKNPWPQEVHPELETRERINALRAIDYDKPVQLIAQEISKSPLPWRDMESAPKDGRILLLLVEFTENQLEDESLPQATIGSNTYANHEQNDVWQFAGWCWEHDCYTEGQGKVLGWMPFPDVLWGRNNPWWLAIDEALISNCLSPIMNGEPAAEALGRLISWEVQTALDPAVSEEAEHLRLQGRQQGLEVAMNIFHGNIQSGVADIGYALQREAESNEACMAAVERKTGKTKPLAQAVGDLLGDELATIIRTARGAWEGETDLVEALEKVCAAFGIDYEPFPVRDPNQLPLMLSPADQAMAEEFIKDLSKPSVLSMIDPTKVAQVQVKVEGNSPFLDALKSGLKLKPSSPDEESK